MNIMIKPISIVTPKAKLFCQQYWERVLAGAKPLDHRFVSQHDILHDVNLTLLRRNRSTSLSPFGAVRTIKQTDKEFKLLKPTTQNLTLWRGVSAPSYKEREFIGAFDKACFVQKGQKTCMTEYAFATEKRKAAELYAPKDIRGILYEIEVPEGARLSYNFNYIFPRFSIFECLETKMMNFALNPLKYVKLRYLLPENFFKIS